MEEADNKLAAKAALRDEKAFEELMRRYGGLIKSIAAYHLRSIPMWRDDCINDIFLTVWQNIDRFDPDKSTFKNWLGAVAKYRSVNYIKQHYRQLLNVEADESIADDRDIEAELLKEEADKEALSLLEPLNERDREIFIRRYFREESVSEIARSINKKPEWIYNRLSRGRIRLRSSLNMKRRDYLEE